MRARSNVYHLECFACQECGHRFCVGDQFFLHDNKVMMMMMMMMLMMMMMIVMIIKILCGPDYEERMVFASLSSNPLAAAQLAAIKHQDSRPYFPLNNNTINIPQQQHNNNTINIPQQQHNNNTVRDKTPLPPISSVRPPPFISDRTA